MQETYFVPQSWQPSEHSPANWQLRTPHQVSAADWLMAGQSAGQCHRGRSGLTNRATRTLESNTGTFYATNLPVGGPYIVTINNSKTVTIDSIQLGDIYNLTVDMGAPSEVEEILVFGQANTLVDIAAGPAATFGTFDLDTAVAYNRDIRDVYSLDPRFNLDGA